MSLFHKKFKNYVLESKEFLRLKNELYPTFWREKQLNPKVTQKLIEIAQDVIESIKIDLKVEDLIITGSIASYNWHSKSDIDMHILLDFTSIDDNFSIVKEMFDAIRIAWNMKHDIEIFGHEVEIYFQDINEPHESIGMYSIIDGAWIAEPIQQDVEFDLRNIEKKADALERSIKHAQKLLQAKRFEETHEYSSKLMKKIKRMRQSGLEEDGVYSVENMAFKMLRNSGNLEKLAFCRDLSYDRMMSLTISENIFSFRSQKTDLQKEIGKYFKSEFRTEKGKYDEHPYSDVRSLLDLEMPAPWQKQ